MIIKNLIKINYKILIILIQRHNWIIQYYKHVNKMLFMNYKFNKKNIEKILERHN